MKDEEKVIAREYEYEFDDHETCERCAVMIMALIGMMAEMGDTLPERITLEAFKNGNPLACRTCARRAGHKLRYDDRKVHGV